MKFLCEQCKAKYQIADEKAAGKTVRMKCRKCGHLIEVRAAVTESSVARQAPRPPLASSADADPAGLSKAAGGVPRPSNKPGTPARGGTLATSLAAAKPAGPPERPVGALAGAFKSTVQRDDDGAAPFDMSDGSPDDEWYVAINGVPVGPIRVGEVRRKAALGAVTEESLCWQEGLDEWRPVRAFPQLATTVREAISSGRSSLTPPPPEGRVSAPPAQPRQRMPSQAQARPSSAPALSPASWQPQWQTQALPPSAPQVPPHPAGPASMRGGAVRPGAPAAARVPISSASSARPAQPAAPLVRSNVVPISSRLATAEKLAQVQEDAASPASSDLEPALADVSPSSGTAASQAPSAQGPTARASDSKGPAARPAGIVTVDPLALPPRASLIAGPPLASTPTTASVDAFDAPARKSPPWMAYAMIAAALAFGMTAGVAAFLRPPPPAPVIVQLPAPAPAPTPAATPAASAADPVPAPPSHASTKTPSPKAAAAGGSKTPAAAPPGHGPLDLHGLGTNISPIADTSSEGPSAPGQCFSTAQVQQVIGMHQAAIRRSCWERNPTTKPVVNVSVSMTITADGSTQAVSASAEEPSIAKCVENDVRNWHFAAMGCSQQTTFTVHLVRQ